MGLLFISYRREDSGDTTGRIDDWLSPVFGRDNIFLDFQSIPYGVDFESFLRSKIALCQIMIVVIGKSWMQIAEARKRGNLAQQPDYVNLEIALALEMQKKVLPLLVQNAQMPKESSLSIEIRPLARLQAISIRPNPDFNDDIRHLIEFVKHEMGYTDRIAPPGHARLSPPFLLHEWLEHHGFTAHRIDGKDVIIPPMVAVPTGPFLMGSTRQLDKQAVEEEFEQHIVTLPSYEIAAYPLTVAEYTCFLKDTNQAPPLDLQLSGSERVTLSWRNKILTWQDQIMERAHHPVVGITWHDAQAYTAWLSQCTGQLWGLPSEAEWERAARGTDGRLYPWGNEWNKNNANVYGSGFGTTTPVGFFEHAFSNVGCWDMIGNVWEWTSSLYKPYPYNADDGRENLNIDSNKVVRGGSWDYDVKVARVAYRKSCSPFYGYSYIGTRLARIRQK